MENGFLLPPSDVTHYFAPNANSTGEFLTFRNESVPVMDISDAYVFYYDGKLMAFKLGNQQA